MSRDIKRATLYSNQEMVANFGVPNQSGTYLVSAKIPFPLIIAWDHSQTVSRIRCHRLVTIPT